MSFDAITWALEHSPVSCPYERLLLSCLARRANSDGTDCYPSRRSLAGVGLCDKSTVTRKLNALEKRGIIREGDQRAAARIPEHLRPKVYDIQIPYSYYSPEQLQRVNRERHDRGLGPLTPENRPDLGPAPERKARADKGKPKAKKQRPKSKGGASSTPSPEEASAPDSPQLEGGASSTRVLEAPQGGASSTPNLSWDSVPSLSGEPAVTDAPADSWAGERDSAAPTDPPPVPEVPHQRAEQPDTPEEDAARVVDAYVAACRSTGVVPFRQVKDRVGEQARELLAEGCPAGWLADRAAEMPANRWTDLAKHASRSKVPMTKAAPRRAAAQNSQDADLPPYCGDLDCDELTRMLRTEDAGGLPQIEPCPRCHPSKVRHALT